MMQVIESLLLLNRTIVSSDDERCMSVLGEHVPLAIHRYPSGEEYGTWVIPPQWDVNKAELSDGDKIIASYQDHPLFLAPYSCSFTGWVTREELLEHVRFAKHQPDAYSYEHRFAYDYQTRLTDWAITLPYSLTQQLDREKYFVDIQIETAPGEMLVGESTVAGRNDYTFAFLTHLCHPGQANDGLAGVAVGVEVMKRIGEEFQDPNFNYQLLIMPETVGSSVYLASDPERIDSYLGSVFIEMAGISSPVSLKNTRRGNTYLDRVLRQVIKDSGLEFTECSFRDAYGNDEMVFDSPGVGIPGATIQRYPYDAYHTSADDLEETDESKLEELVEILMATVRLMESDFIPSLRQRVPVWLTRYDLYADAHTDKTQHNLNATVLDAIESGWSVFDIAQQVEIPYDVVREYLRKFVDQGLMEALPLDPQYFRHSLEIPG